MAVLEAVEQNKALKHGYWRACDAKDPVGFRDSFVADVERYTSGPQWVIELQYREVRPLLLERADTLLWLDYPTSVQMTRLMRRTLRRRLLRQEL